MGVAEVASVFGYFFGFAGDYVRFYGVAKISQTIIIMNKCILVIDIPIKKFYVLKVTDPALTPLGEAMTKVILLGTGANPRGNDESYPMRALVPPGEIMTKSSCADTGVIRRGNDKVIHTDLMKVIRMDDLTRMNQHYCASMN